MSPLLCSFCNFWGGGSQNFGALPFPPQVFAFLQIGNFRKEKFWHNYILHAQRYVVCPKIASHFHTVVTVDLPTGFVVKVFALSPLRVLTRFAIDLMYGDTEMKKLTRHLDFFSSTRSLVLFSAPYQNITVRYLNQTTHL